MPELSESIKAIREGSKEEPFTYLTILQYHVNTPGILPTLNEVLQNAELTRDIGWDLVETLVNVDGSEDCLETVARSGNPREVIIKVMETLAALAKRLEDDDDDDHDNATAEDVESEAKPDPSALHDRIITLIGMLAILQRRIKTKYPSRFLGPSLVSVLEAYQPTPEMTTAVINLVRSLSGRKRPPLPIRTSSIDIFNPDESGDFTKNAPDPEAEQEDPKEESLNQRLLQSFTTCILQRYANEHEMQWSPRLFEVYHPELIVPGKPTVTKAFREDEELQKRDAIVGQIAALLWDLGMRDISADFVRNVICRPSTANPLASLETFESIDDIYLSPGGAVCLAAYWIFSADAFAADNSGPNIHLFPDHLAMLQLFLGSNAQEEINNNPGIADALLAIGMGLQHRGSVAAAEQQNYMAYHHCLTLISVFHPDIQVRNAATRFAGDLLHADPDDESRREILEDLLQNCTFPALNACAIKWLQREIIAAQSSKASDLFSTSEVIERLKYDLFPDIRPIAKQDSEKFLEVWQEQQAFYIQAATFAYFLFNSHSARNMVPNGLGALLEQRFIEPLRDATTKLQKTSGLDGYDPMQLDILQDRLDKINIR